MTGFFVGPFAIQPHPEAPQFATRESAELYFGQVLGEMQSASLNPSKEAWSLIRQLGFSSLWFYLNCLLAPFGPYDRLGDSLSLSMCNFRQSDAWEAPGAHAAAFIPRGFFKSTIFTTGGTSWDLLRNPDERAVIVNATYDKAMEFFHQVERNFDSNELIAEFYPEYIVGKRGGKLTDKEFVLPNRARSSVEPSLRTLGLTGASEGGHYSLITMDDLVGLDSLDAQRQSAAVMETAKKWFRTNRRALRLDGKSRLGVVATRYAVDDCYADIYSSCKSVTGWKGGDLVADAGGTWDVYYRLVEEEGVFLRADVMNKEDLEELLKEDYWAAVTQYYNSPSKAGLAEFAESVVKTCSLRWDEDGKEWWIDREDKGNYREGEEGLASVRLSTCDLIVSTDLAATDKGISAKTCRSSIAAWAKDGHNNVYRIWSKVGFFGIHQTIDYIFEVNDFFGGLVRVTFVEANAFQKIVKPILDREQEVREKYFAVNAVNATGDKKARIRVCLGNYLARGQIWLAKGCGLEFLQELKLFPMSNSRLDVLDESEKGITFSLRPESSEERWNREDAEMRMPMMVLGAVGY